MGETEQYPANVRGVIKSAERLGLEAKVQRSMGYYYFQFGLRGGLEGIGVGAVKGVKLARVALQFYGVGFRHGNVQGLKQR